MMMMMRKIHFFLSFIIIILIINTFINLPLVESIGDINACVNSLIENPSLFQNENSIFVSNIPDYSNTLQYTGTKQSPVPSNFVNNAFLLAISNNKENIIFNEGNYYNVSEISLSILPKFSLYGGLNTDFTVFSALNLGSLLYFTSSTTQLMSSTSINCLIISRMQLLVNDTNNNPHYPIKTSSTYRGNSYGLFLKDTSLYLYKSKIKSPKGGDASSGDEIRGRSARTGEIGGTPGNGTMGGRTTSECRLTYCFCLEPYIYPYLAGYGGTSTCSFRAADKSTTGGAGGLPRYGSTYGANGADSSAFPGSGGGGVQGNTFD